MKLFLAKCNNAEGHKNSYYVNFNTHTNNNRWNFVERGPLKLWIIAKQLRRNDNNHYARFLWNKKVSFRNPLWILFVKYGYTELTSLLLSFFSVHTCENMPSVCNERGFTNIHKLFNIETCTISRRPHARFFNGGLSRKKEKEKEA